MTDLHQLFLRGLEDIIEYIENDAPATAIGKAKQLLKFLDDVSIETLE